MLRRLHADQPAAFAFTPANEEWARREIRKYPEGRQASAVIALLWRAQEQEGWLTRPAIEHVADRLGLPYIRALEVATFYFMFQLSPVGSVAHVQICGTTPCMLRGAEALVELCQHRISAEPRHPSADGRLSWEEVECLGACANAPMAQIGRDYYEDLSPESLGRILDEIEAGRVPRPGSQIGRFASEPAGGPTSLTAWAGEAREAHNGSVARALAFGDTIRRIDGTEQPLRSPWLATPPPEEPAPIPVEAGHDPRPGAGLPADETGTLVQQAPADSAAKPPGPSNPDGGLAGAAPPPAGEGGPSSGAAVAGPTTATTAPPPAPERAPLRLREARGGVPDDLEAIAGIDARLAELLNRLGFWHFDQIAGWGPGEVAWVDSRLGAFRGCAERDDWIGQARRLAEEKGRWPSAKIPGP